MHFYCPNDNNKPGLFLSAGRLPQRPLEEQSAAELPRPGRDVLARLQQCLKPAPLELRGTKGTTLSYNNRAANVLLGLGTEPCLPR